MDLQPRLQEKPGAGTDAVTSSEDTRVIGLGPRCVWVDGIFAQDGDWSFFYRATAIMVTAAP